MKTRKILMTGLLALTAGLAQAQLNTLDPLTEAPELKPVPALAEYLRPWKDVQGNEIQASLFALDDNVAWLQSVPGQIMPVPRNQLSPDDNAFLREQTPTGAPASPPNVRVEIKPKRGTSVDRQINEIEQTFNGTNDTDTKYTESRAIQTFVHLELLFSSGQPLDLEVRYYAAEKVDDAWSISFIKRYDPAVTPPERPTLKTQPLLVSSRDTRGGTSLVKPEDQPNFFPEDWVVGVYWRDPTGRLYLLESDASNGDILKNDEIKGQLARALGDDSADRGVSVNPFADTPAP